jgi:hypothetical protein
LACVTFAGDVKYLLGSWHVLTNKYGKDGDPVYMPSIALSTNPAVVGTLVGTPQFHLNGGSNAFDASVVQVSPGVTIPTSIIGRGPLLLPCAMPEYGPVVKQGAVTGYTTGAIDGVSEDIPIMYNGEASDQAILTGQMAIVGDSGRFSDEGDSGSLVCTPNLHPVGLIVGGGLSTAQSPLLHSFASPIQPILDFYDVEIQP